MKKIALAVVAALALAGGLAWAAPIELFRTEVVMLGGYQTGTNATVSTAGNKVTRSLAGSAVIDFGSVSITCTDSSAITITGAQTGDPCFVGAPTTAAANSTFTCFVSAADAVKVRHCPAGTAIDPASATYRVRVISSQ